MGAAIVTGVDAPPVLQFGEQVLDQVAFLADRLVIVILHLAVGFWRNAWGYAALGQGRPEPVAVITFVAQQFLGTW